MTRGTRRSLFYGLFILFFTLSALVILYAEGWRVDFSNFKTVVVGGIYVRAYPADVSITLNGKPVENQAGFLSRGTFISNLFPADYTVELDRSGYVSWKENVSVAPSLVAELNYAVLVPENASSVASSSLVGAALRVGTIVDGSPRTLIVRKSAASSAYAAYDLVNGTTTDLSALLQKNGVVISGILAMSADPSNDQGVITETRSRIWSTDLGADRSTLLATTTAPHEAMLPALAVSRSVIAWAETSVASKTSYLAFYDRGTDTIATSTVTFKTPIANIVWIRDNFLGVTLADGSAYSYDVGGKDLEKLADDAKAIYPTDDGSAIAVLENRSVEIFRLRDGKYSRFNLSDIGNVQTLIWYRDRNHLFVVYPDRVTFFDLADVGLYNVITVSLGANPYYDPNANMLYLRDPAKDPIVFTFSS